MERVIIDHPGYQPYSCQIKTQVWGVDELLCTIQLKKSCKIKRINLNCNTFIWASLTCWTISIVSRFSKRYIYSVLNSSRIVLAVTQRFNNPWQLSKRLQRTSHLHLCRRFTSSLKSLLSLNNVSPLELLYALKSHLAPFQFTAFKSRDLYKQICQRDQYSSVARIKDFHCYVFFIKIGDMEEIPQVVCDEVFHLWIASSLNLALVGRRLFTAGCPTRFLVKWRKWTGVATQKKNK